ncbi:MAG: thioesterase family protein [Candidatus Dormibacteria bacterium]
MSEAIYRREGDDYFPGTLAGGPWDPTAAQHGGAPAALACRAIEAVPSETPMLVARVTFEILRSVPMSPLRVSAQLTRPGKRVQLVEATITAGDHEVVRARALRIRATSLPLDEPASNALPPPPPPAECEAVEIPPNTGIGFFSAFELRHVSGGILTPGPACLWFRLRSEIVAGESPSPLMRVAAAADFGNGISQLMDFTNHLFINPDLTIHLGRHPVGEWIALDARTLLGPTGMGMSESALWDEKGRIGRSLQSLFLDRR